MLNRRFVSVRVNMREVTPASRQAFAIARPFWAPTFVFIDARQIELRRWTGWLPPVEFIHELLLALGAHDMLHRRFGDAYDRFREAVNDYPGAAAAPEGFFLAAAAAYQRDGRKLPSLELRLRELVSRYPDSVWARKADILDMKDASDGGS